jgi:Arc/MetJ-type ribon-helix-helix transcriptional regulator
MLTMIAIKLDPKMKKAIEEIALKKFMSMSGFIKAAVEEALKKEGVDWRQGKPPKKPKSPHT